MQNRPAIQGTGTSGPVSRRTLLGGIGSAVAVGIAGCLGDDSRAELGESMEQTGTHLEDAGRSFDELTGQMEDENWEGCLSSIDPVRDDLASAEQEASDAQQLAEDEGHSDYSNAATAAIELIDVMERMLDEMEGLCQAAIDEDFEETDRRLEAIEDLEQERQQRQRELDEAIAAIDG